MLHHEGLTFRQRENESSFIAFLQGIKLFPQKITGKKVVIKPNVLRASKANEHIVTNPAVLAAVVETVEKMAPASPDLRDIGLVLAADNSVALDGVVARMMGLDPGLLRFLQKAKALGLGDYEDGKFVIDGEMRVIPDFKIPFLGGEAIAGNQTIQEFFEGRSGVRPRADSDLCTACGSCIDHCPVSALTMEDDLTRVSVRKRPWP